MLAWSVVLNLESEAEGDMEECGVRQETRPWARSRVSSPSRGRAVLRREREWSTRVRWEEWSRNSRIRNFRSGCNTQNIPTTPTIAT